LPKCSYCTREWVLQRIIIKFFKECWIERTLYQGFGDLRDSPYSNLLGRAVFAGARGIVVILIIIRRPATRTWRTLDLARSIGALYILAYVVSLIYLIKLAGVCFE
jgi:hypothetical protein